MTQFLQTLMDGISVGALYALIALGYTLVYGVLQFINFAHSDVFALGAWLSLVIAGALASAFGWMMPEGVVSHGLLLAPIVMVAAMIACGIVGFFIEFLAYRPLRNAPRLNVLITAIGVSLFLQNTGALANTFGNRPRPLPEMLPQVPLATFAGVNLRPADLLILVTSLVLMVALHLLVFHTRTGSAMRAVSYNPRAAALMGINVSRIISFTFVLGAMLASSAGFLYANKYPILKQTADSVWVLLGLKAFVAAVVGGIGNIRGAVLGGLCIGLIEFFGVTYVSDKYRDVYVFAILILVLLIRPAGILGKATTEKV